MGHRFWRMNGLNEDRWKNCILGDEGVLMDQSTLDVLDINTVIKMYNT